MPVAIAAADNQESPTTHNGGSLHCMSIGFLLGNRDDAVVWRGPRKQAMIRQLVERVCWPPGVQYLLVDTPPGTSDEHLAIVERLLPAVLGTNGAVDGSHQSQPSSPHASGAILVTTPQVRYISCWSAD